MGYFHHIPLGSSFSSCQSVESSGHRANLHTLQATNCIMTGLPPAVAFDGVQRDVEGRLTCRGFVENKGQATHQG